MESVREFILSTALFLLFCIIGTPDVHANNLPPCTEESTSASAFLPQETPLERTLFLLYFSNKAADVLQMFNLVASHSHISYKVLPAFVSSLSNLYRYSLQPGVTDSILHNASSRIGTGYYIYTLRRILI